MKVTYETKGWRHVWDTWLSPDGTEYTPCRNGEKPDVLLLGPKGRAAKLTPIKLRLWSTSGAARRVRRAVKAATKREAGKTRRKGTLKGIRRSG